MKQAPDGFARLLARWALRIHLRRLWRAALFGGTAATGIGAVLALLLWGLHVGELRKLSLLLGPSGAALGAVFAVARRWTRTEVALFLDARLHTAEVVTTALTTTGNTNEVAQLVRARAEQALSHANPAATRTRVWSRWHALLVPAVVATLILCALPKRPLPVRPSAPGAALVRRNAVPGLDRVENLNTAPSLSSADTDRLKRLAEEARRLRSDLSRGLEQREAQARILSLREGIAAAREHFGSRAERPALEAAVEALEGERATRPAAKALGDGDVVAFDDEMQRLANRAESEARAAARQALEKAAREARQRHAEQLLEMLERQRESFARREARMRALRELADALEQHLGPEARRDRVELDNQGNPEAARRLSRALADALSGLSEEERRRLAENLKQRLAGQGETETEMLSSEELERLARELSNPGGRERLEQALRELAKGESGLDAERERALGDAERGSAEAERALGGAPLPLPLGSPGNLADSRQGPGADGKSGTDGTSDGTRGGGRGQHEGTSATVRGNELRARANAQWLPGAPLAARSLGRAPGRAGETANQVGTHDFQSRGSAEVGAVEGADIPEEYREHVGRYFEP